MTTVEGLKDKKLRSFGSQLPLIWKAVGAVPVTVTAAEWYEAFQKGYMDAHCVTMENALDYKLQEIANYVSFDMPGIASAAPLFINLDVWNSLSPDIQKAMEEVREVVTIWNLYEDTRRDQLGRNLFPEEAFLNVPEAEQEKLFEICLQSTELWVEEMEEKGLGEKARTFLTHWKEEAEKFRKY